LFLLINAFKNCDINRKKNMSENTPLLQNEQNGSSSTSSSNASEGSNVKSRNHLFDNQQSYQSTSSSVFANERNEAWMKNQRELINMSGKKASVRKRLAFRCDTSRIGRIWELFDATLSAMFVLLYIWVSVFGFFDTFMAQYKWTLTLS
jgi:hypothetical protein